MAELGGGEGEDSEGKGTLTLVGPACAYARARRCLTQRWCWYKGSRRVPAICYALAMRCPVLAKDTPVLGLTKDVSVPESSCGTDIGYSCTRKDGLRMRGAVLEAVQAGHVVLLRTAIGLLLRTCYAMSGTVVGYATVRYAMSGTDIGYAATRLLLDNGADVHFRSGP
eukprot:3939352-Rhodomonas_salina.1